MSFSGKWLPDSQAYRSECLKISENLTDFKQNPIYCRYINNDNRSLAIAIAFYSYIKKNYPYLLNNIGLFQRNDRIGSPTLYEIDGHTISPGTLRFMKVLGDISPYPWTSIVEIGAGYGGQCKIIKLWRTDTDYTIIDIPESLEVSRAYLRALNESVTFIDKIEAPVSRDLVISDYCITELNIAGVDYYVDNVVRYCRMGYFTCNVGNSTDHLIERLKKIFRTVEIKPEVPATSRHKNVIIYALGNFEL